MRVINDNADVETIFNHDGIFGVLNELIFCAHGMDAQPASPTFGILSVYRLLIATSFRIVPIFTALAIVNTLCSSIVATYVPHHMREFVDSMLHNGENGAEITCMPAVWLLSATLIAAFSSALQGRLIYKVATSVEDRFRVLGLLHFFRQDMAWHNSHSSSFSGAQMDRGGSAIYDLVNDAFPLIELAGSVVGAIISMAHAASINQMLPLAILAPAPIYIALNRHLSRKVTEIQGPVNAEWDSSKRLLNESTRLFVVVKAFRQEGAECGKFAHHWTKYHRLRMKQEWLCGGIMLLKSICELLVKFLVFMIARYGAGPLGSEKLSAGATLQLIGLYHLVYSPIDRILAINLSTKNDVKRCTDLLNMCVSEPAPAVSLALRSNELLLDQPPDCIQFTNVDFTYDERSKKGFHLRKFNASIPLGAITAIVGRSGSGKSTVLSLLLGLHRPHSGFITWNGEHLDNQVAGHDALTISVTYQDPLLFERTIRDNIAYGRPDASDEDILEAARVACCDEFISCLPEGYSTMLSNGGSTISGGQRQRVALARAILAKPLLLLVDEGTSQLDKETERMVLNNLSKLCAQQAMTIVIVTHQPAAAHGAQHVIFMAEGRMVGEGTHSELRARYTAYAELA